MTLDEYLKQERRPLRWAGDACGVSRQAVFNWIASRSTPSHKHAKIIEDMTGGKVQAKQWREENEDVPPED